MQIGVTVKSQHSWSAIVSWKGFGELGEVEKSGSSGWRRPRSLEQEGICQ